MSATQALEDPHLRRRALTPTIVTTVLATFVVLLRLATRWKLVQATGFDDLVIVISLVLSWAVFGLTVSMIKNGFGTYVWNNPLDLHPLPAKLFMAWNCVYIVLINITKASILTQYLRLFHTRTMRRLTYALLACLVPPVLWGVFGAVFLCDPVRKVWDPMVKGSCMSLRVYWLSTTAVNIVLDVAVLVLPMWSIIRLHLPRRQKFWLVLVFLLGFFTCGVSMVRVALVHDAYAEKNYTESSFDALIWSIVEANTGIICASLLALKPLIVYMFPQTAQDTQPPRWSMTLNVIEDVEKNTKDDKAICEKRDSIWMTRTRVGSNGSDQIGDERMVVGKTRTCTSQQKRVSISGKSRKQMSDGTSQVKKCNGWNEEIIDEVEDTLSRPEAVFSTPFRRPILEGEGWGPKNERLEDDEPGPDIDPRGSV